MKRFKQVFIFILLAALLLVACTRQPVLPLRIALSKGSPDTSYANYYNWIKSLDTSVVCVDMYAMALDSAMKLFRTCSGLLLTGGTDINPALYDKSHETIRCWPIDEHRDHLEMMLIDSALAWGIPILGICRGHQMLNVALGGSLIVDIPADFETLISHQCEDYLSCFHPAAIDTATLLYKVTGTVSGIVNSNHHQAVDVLAEPLRPSAFGEDGLIEAIEWKNPEGKSFLIGVQWHPERMDLENSLSGTIGKAFLSAAGARITFPKK